MLIAPATTRCKPTTTNDFAKTMIYLALSASPGSNAEAVVMSVNILRNKLQTNRQTTVITTKRNFFVNHPFIQKISRDRSSC